jgi:hypothetical protein
MTRIFCNRCEKLLEGIEQFSSITIKCGASAEILLDYSEISGAHLCNFCLRQLSLFLNTRPSSKNTTV